MFIVKCLQVVGLGNHTMPATRHSIGMATIDKLCRQLKSNWKKDGDCQGDIAIATLDDHLQLILLKPRLLMNINGRSVIKTGTVIYHYVNLFMSYLSKI